MIIQSELCHIENSRIIVRVSAWEGNKNLGSALGEAGEVHAAEEKAISFLLQRFKQMNGIEYRFQSKTPKNPIIQNDSQDNSLIHKTEGDHLSTPTNLSTVRVENPKASDKNSIEPEDWSQELAEVETLISKLGWNRQKENSFLTETFEITNRNKITKFSTFMKYLRKLRELDNSNNLVNKNTSDLIEYSDQLIMKLNWDTDIAREFLVKRFNVTSRSNLTQNQLKDFINYLNQEIESSTK